MVQRFAQISDPHLSSLLEVRPAELLNKRLLGYLSWRRKRRFEHRTEVLDALLQDLQGHHFEQLLVTGDLTHIGLPSEFRQARDWLQRLGPANQVALVPGNHDSCVAAPWEQTYALWDAYMQSDQASNERAGLPFPSFRQRGDLAYIGLSTACPTPPLMATGHISEQQLEQLPGLLDAAAADNLFRVVYLHHSPLPGKEKWRKRLTNAPALAKIIAEHGAELILHGHGHRARSFELETVAGPAQVMAVPSASALGLHGADCAAYNCYEISRQADGWRLQLGARRYCREREAFTTGPERTLSIKRLLPQPSPGNP
ncbi:MAG: metallophosphoesterase [Halieaceae bacterium]